MQPLLKPDGGSSAARSEKARLVSMLERCHASRMAQLAGPAAENSLCQRLVLQMEDEAICQEIEHCYSLAR